MEKVNVRRPRCLAAAGRMIQEQYGFFHPINKEMWPVLWSWRTSLHEVSAKWRIRGHNSTLKP